MLMYGKTLKRIIFIMGVLFVITFTVSGSFGTEPLKIGITTALTGANAVMGRSIREGAEMATAEINAAGGVDGREVITLISDDRVIPAEGVSNALRYITKDKVSVLMTTTGSSVTMAVMPLAEQNKIPLITPAGTADMITQKGNKWVFQACPNNTDTIIRQVDYIATQIKPKPRTAAMVWENTDYGVNMLDILPKLLAKYDIKVVADVSYMQDSTEYYSELTKLKAANPDVVFFLGKYTDNGLLVKQAREIGLKAEYTGGNTWVIEEFLKIAGVAANNGTYPSFFETSIVTPKAQAFVNNYRTKYGRDPDWLAASSYDSIYIVADAVKRAKSVDPVAIRDALAATKNLEGVSGITTFDENGHTLRKVLMTKIIDGKRVVQDF